MKATNIETNTPIIGLTNSNFKIYIGSQQVTFTLLRYDYDTNEYVFSVATTPVSSSGNYSLKIELIFGNKVAVSSVNDGTVRYVEEATIKSIDLVFVIDTSGSMGDEWGDMETIVPSIINGLANMSIDLKIGIYGLAGSWYDTIGNISVVPLYNGTYNGTDGTLSSQSMQDEEAYAQGAAWLAKHYDWKAASARVVIPISDSTPYGGSESGYMYNADHIAVNSSIDIANEYGVIYYPLYGVEVRGAPHLELYERLASGTGGKATYFYDADQVVGEISSLTQVKVGGATTLLMAEDTINPSESKITGVYIDSSVSEVTFSAKIKGSEIGLDIIDPAGNLTNETSVQNNTNIKFVKMGTYKAYTVYNITPGIWLLRVKGTNVQYGESYSISVTGMTNITMSMSTNKNQYSISEPIKITASITTKNSVAGSAYIAAGITDPYGHLHEITLFDDCSHGDGGANDGLFANYFTQTSYSGTYTVNVIAYGTVNNESFVRASQQTVYVSGTSYKQLTTSKPSYTLVTRSGGLTNATVEFQAFSNVSGILSITDLQNTEGAIIPASYIALSKGIISITKGKNDSLEVSIKVPSATTSGVYTGKLIVESGTTYTVPISVDVRAFYVNITPQNIAVNVSQGQSLTVSIQINLTGYGGLDNLKIFITGDISDWATYKLANTSIPENGSATINFVLQPSSTLLSGTYYGTVYVTSTDTAPIPITVMVNVEPKSPVKPSEFILPITYIPLVIFVILICAGIGFGLKHRRERVLVRREIPPFRPPNICPYCGAGIEPDWSACPYCGTDLIKLCPNCSSKIEEGWNACPYCGNEYGK